MVVCVVLAGEVGEGLGPPLAGIPLDNQVLSLDTAQPPQFLEKRSISADTGIAHQSDRPGGADDRNPVQLGLFDGTRLDTHSLARAADKVNDKYGEFTVIPATMANMAQVIIKRVPFGSVRDV